MNGICVVGSLFCVLTLIYLPSKGIDNGVYKLINTFHAELHAFTFPEDVSGALASYTAYTA